MVVFVRFVPSYSPVYIVQNFVEWRVREDTLLATPAQSSAVNKQPLSASWRSCKLPEHFGIVMIMGYQSARRHIPEDSGLYRHYCHNVISKFHSTDCNHQDVNIVRKHSGAMALLLAVHQAVLLCRGRLPIC